MYVGVGNHVYVHADCTVLCALFACFEMRTCGTMTSLALPVVLQTSVQIVYRARVAQVAALVVRWPGALVPSLIDCT